LREPGAKGHEDATGGEGRREGPVSTSRWWKGRKAKGRRGDENLLPCSVGQRP